MVLYDVIVVGAGPAGLFAGLMLGKSRKNLNVLIIEQGNSLEKRKRTETMSGIGGAGTFSDGKLHFTPVLSHEKLLDLFSLSIYKRYLDKVDKLFTSFGVDAFYTPQNIEEASSLVQDCQRKGVQLYLRKCKHIGSDCTKGVVVNIINVLKDRKVKILCNTKVEEVLVKDGQVCGLKCGKKIFRAKKFLLAPGRIGTSWLQKQAEKIDIEYSYQKVEIGVRVEFPASIMAEHSKIMHENIYAVRTSTYDDVVRTFCPCPNGRVAIEHYGGYISVNGFSSKRSRSENSNFDLTTEFELTEPVENTTDYAISIAKTATVIGGGKPLIQRVADLKAGRRSTWKRIRRSYVVPTLTDVTPGDISMALPHRVVANIIEGLEILDRVLPGVNSGATLIYAPEIKLRGNRLKINKRMQAGFKNLFVAGDGAGVSGNIVGAAVSGILAAEGVLKTGW